MRSDILHADLDAFYASVARGRCPETTGRPLIVGGSGSRGVVLSCSYEARASGVRNGMPAMRARRLCPDAVFVPPDFDAYAAASKRFRAVLEAFTPLIEPISLDEAFCDVSGAHRLWGPSHEIGQTIRERVRAELGLTCSVGGGPTKLVAKIASRRCKPDGLLVVDDPEAFLRPLPVGELWGVGGVTAAALQRIGVRTVGDLADMPSATLRRELGEAAGAHLQRLARGDDPSPVVTGHEAKSIGAEETFDTDIGDPERLGSELLRLSDRVASRLLAGGLSARTITVKIRLARSGAERPSQRLASFETHTRSTTLDTPTADVWTIHSAATDAFARFRRGRARLRLLGVQASGLQTGAVAEQLSFERGPDYPRAGRALHEVRGRFGSDAVRLGRLLDPPTRS